MRHYVLVGEERDVLGVWEASDEVAAARIRLQVSLSFPGCRTEAHEAENFEAVKGRSAFDLEHVVPETAIA